MNRIFGRIRLKKHPLVRGRAGPPQDHVIDFRAFLNLARRRAPGSPRLVQLDELSSHKVPGKNTFERLHKVHHTATKRNALYQAQQLEGCWTLRWFDRSTSSVERTAISKSNRGAKVQMHLCGDYLFLSREKTFFFECVT